MKAPKARKRTFEEYSDSEDLPKQPLEVPSSSNEQSENSESHSESAPLSEDSSETESELSDNELDGNEAVKQRLSAVSFGALAKAQNALRKSSTADSGRERITNANPDSEDKLAALRKRLRELKEKRTDDGVVRTKSRKGEQEQDTARGIRHSENSRSKITTEQRGQQSGRSFFEQDGQDSGSDTSSHDSEAQGSRKRSSKHAPTAMPANRAVGRHRNVVEVNKIKSRDPRFDVTSGVLDKHTVSQRYSFISDYQASEVSELRKSLKDKKLKLTETERDNIQRKMISLESKISAAKAKERESNVVREHRKREKEMVGQGKKPYFLKKGDIKKQALTDRFEGMKSRQRDKVMERRRKKLASRERRDMPLARRG